MSLLQKLFDRIRKAAKRRKWTWGCWIVAGVIVFTPAFLVTSIVVGTQAAYECLKRSGACLYHEATSAWSNWKPA